MEFIKINISLANTDIKLKVKIGLSTNYLLKSVQFRL